MRVKWQFSARTLACLATGLIPLGAAPIFHVNYHGQVGPFSYDRSVTVGAFVGESGVGYSDDGPCTVVGCGLGAFLFDDVLPRIHLPAGSKVLSAELRQGGSYRMGTTVTTTVTPLGEPSEPSMQSGGSWFLDGQWEFGFPGAEMFCSGYWDSGYGGFECTDPDYAQQVRDALESGSPPPPVVKSVALMLYGGPGVWIWGVNSITADTTEYRFTGSGSYDLAITYEAPIPEPGSACLFLTGAVGLLLLRRLFRTRQT